MHRDERGAQRDTENAIDIAEREVGERCRPMSGTGVVDRDVHTTWCGILHQSANGIVIGDVGGDDPACHLCGIEPGTRSAQGMRDCSSNAAVRADDQFGTTVQSGVHERPDWL